MIQYIWWQVGMSHVWPSTQTPTSASQHFHALGSTSCYVICINRLTQRHGRLSFVSMLNPPVVPGGIWMGRKKALAKWWYLISCVGNVLVAFTCCTLCVCVWCLCGCRFVPLFGLITLVCIPVFNWSVNDPFLYLTKHLPCINLVKHHQ